MAPLKQATKQPTPSKVATAKSRTTKIEQLHAEGNVWFSQQLMQ